MCHVNQPFARLIIRLQEDVAGNLYKKGLQLAFIPGFKYFVQLVIRQVFPALQKLVDFTDKLHGRHYAKRIYRTCLLRRT